MQLYTFASLTHKLMSMKSYALLLPVAGFIIAGASVQTVFADVPPTPTFALPGTPAESEVPTPPEATTTTPVIDESNTATTTVENTNTTSSSNTTVSSSRSSGGGSSSRRSGGGGGGSSSKSKSSTQVASATTYSTTAAVALVKCSGPTRPASDISGNPTLAGLIDLFVALGIIPQDRAARACAALTNSAQTSTTAPIQAFTKTLSLGETHPDVLRLQQFLNARGFTVATVGVGSKGQENTYYGITTAVAVARFQDAYRTELLSPRGLQSGTGNFDQVTLQKANQLLGK